MPSDDFIGYLGDPDFHDGSVVSVVAEGNVARVVVRGASGKEYSVEFYGVKAVQSNRPDGMMLYALTEMRTHTSARCFVFSNWKYDDDASLAVQAEGFSVKSLN